MSEYWVPAPGGENFGQPLFLAHEYGPGVELISYSERGTPGFLVREGGGNAKAVMFRDGLPPHLTQQFGPDPGAIHAMLDVQQRQQQADAAARAAAMAEENWLVLGL